MKRELPGIIKQVGFDFHWDETRVWALDALSEEMPITELIWHLDVPFIWSQPNGYYDVNPREVLEHPEHYVEEYERTVNADTTYPIDVMRWKGRWVILDGLHRLMKLYHAGATRVKVRKIPESAIPFIKK